jgi:hypothetical protein
MRRTADPLERLRAANPVTSVPTVDWAHIRRHIAHGAAEPCARRPRLLVLAGAGCVSVLVLGAITAALLSSASTPSRAPSSTGVCDRGQAGCLGGLRVGVLSQNPVLAPLPNPSVRAAAARSCAVIGPRCVHGCTLPVASPLRSLAPAGPGCTAKTAQQPCIEEVAGAGTKPFTDKALRELKPTLRLLDHNAGAGERPSFCQPTAREQLFRPFPHRTQKRR